MITVVICAVLVVVAADAIWARASLRLRIRTTQAATQRPSHELTAGGSRGGWKPLEEVNREAEAQAGGVADENPFTRIGRSSRRGR
jgi:hypothetical protein